MSALAFLVAAYPGTWAPRAFTAAPAAGIGSAVAFGMNTGTTPGHVAITVSHPANEAAQLPDFLGERIFERIHTILQGHQIGKWGFVDLGAVLSATDIPTEVWNAYRYNAQTMDEIDVTTPGGFGVDDAGSHVSEVFQPLQSRFYTIAVDLDGPPSLNDLALWNFEVPAAPANVIGTRLTPFPFRFNPPWEMGYHFATNVLVASDGTEQRIQQRTLPRRSMEAEVVLGEGDEAEYAYALLFGWNTQAYGVPLWQDVAELASDALVGATVLDITDTTLRDLIPGRICLLWQDHKTWEAVVLDDVTDTTVTTRAPVRTRVWPARTTMLLPIRLGRLPDQVPFTRDARHVSSMRISFLLEGAL